MVCRSFHQWSVEHFHTHRPGSGRPRSTDSREDRRIVRAMVAARTASREEIWAHVYLLCHQEPFGNHLLAAGLRSRVSVARILLTVGHLQARLLWCRGRVDWRVEWRSVVFRDESRFWVYENYGGPRVQRRLGERHFPECILPRQTGPIRSFISYDSR